MKNSVTKLYAVGVQWQNFLCKSVET